MGKLFWVVLLANFALLGGCSSGENVDLYPISTATYDEVNEVVGCKSKYSDDKKDAIFEARYKNHWMTWSGEIDLVDSESAAIDVNHFGLQDLDVEFADKKAGFHLLKGQAITVKFVMKRAGGCFLPFSGKYAVIQ